MGHCEEIYLRIHRSYWLNSFLFFCTGTAISGVSGTNMIYTTIKSMLATIREQKSANSRRLLLSMFCKRIFWAVNLLSWLYRLNMRLAESEPVKCPVTLITQTWGWAAVEGLPGHPIIHTLKKSLCGFWGHNLSASLFRLTLHTPIPQQILSHVCDVASVTKQTFSSTPPNPPAPVGLIDAFQLALFDIVVKPDYNYAYQNPFVAVYCCRVL